MFTQSSHELVLPIYHKPNSENQLSSRIPRMEDCFWTSREIAMETFLEDVVVFISSAFGHMFIERWFVALFRVSHMKPEDSLE